MEYIERVAWRPVVGLTAAERHSRAIAQTSQWAMAAADAGDYEEALSWLRVLAAVEDELPKRISHLRDRCQRAIAVQA